MTVMYVLFETTLVKYVVSGSLTPMTHPHNDTLMCFRVLLWLFRTPRSQVEVWWSCVDILDQGTCSVWSRSSQNRTSQIRCVCRHVVFSRDFRNLTKVDTKDSTVVGLCYGDVYCVMKTFVTFTRVCSRLIESCVGLTTSFYTDTLNWLRKYPWPQYGIHKHAHLYDGFCWTLRS